MDEIQEILNKYKQQNIHGIYYISETDFVMVDKDVTNLFEKRKQIINKPTLCEKNNLPLDVKLSYNKSVEFLQTIKNYENGFIDNDQFIIKMREIENEYLKII
jgi:hypothetical protein